MNVRSNLEKRIRKTQVHQKRQRDKSVKNNKLFEDVLLLYDPPLKIGKAYNFAKSFCGSYKIVHYIRGGAEIQLVIKQNQS